MRTSPRVKGVFLNLAMVWGIGSQVAAFGQEVKLTVPEDDPIKNSTPVKSIAFSPDGNLVATGHGTPLGMLQKPAPGQTILWDSRTGKRVKTFAAIKDGVHSVAFSPNGMILAVLESPGIIRLIALPAGREILKLDMNQKDHGFYSFAFFPDGEHLAVGITGSVGDKGSDVLIIDTTIGKPIRTLTGHLGSVGSVAVSPDGKLLASGAQDGTARIWDGVTGKSLVTLKFPSLRKKAGKEDKEGFEDLLVWAQSVAFSPDGRTLAAAASYEFQSAAVEFWDIAAGRSKGTLNDIDPQVRQVVFSPNGKTLVTVGSNGSTKLWDTATLKESGAVEGCWPIALSPDGKAVAATVDVRTVVIQKAPEAIRR